MAAKKQTEVYHGEPTVRAPAEEAVSGYALLHDTNLVRQQQAAYYLQALADVAIRADRADMISKEEARAHVNYALDHLKALAEALA